LLILHCFSEARLRIVFGAFFLDFYTPGTSKSMLLQ
jgi:hypothetical protein